MAHTEAELGRRELRALDHFVLDWPRALDQLLVIEVLHLGLDERGPRRIHDRPLTRAYVKVHLLRPDVGALAVDDDVLLVGAKDDETCVNQATLHVAELRSAKLWALLQVRDDVHRLLLHKAR